MVLAASRSSAESVEVAGELMRCSSGLAVERDARRAPQRSVLVSNQPDRDSLEHGRQSALVEERAHEPPAREHRADLGRDAAADEQAVHGEELEGDVAGLRSIDVA